MGAGFFSISSQRFIVLRYYKYRLEQYANSNHKKPFPHIIPPLYSDGISSLQNQN